MPTTTPNYNLGIPSHGDTNYVETLTSTITDIDTALSTIVGSQINIDAIDHLTIGTRLGTTGTYSFAQGLNCTASGNYSHAEGYETIASGYYSHAENDRSVASGNYSHAEGNSTASNMYSHSEGCSTTASGSYSHTEGYFTIAHGDYSHSQGRGTKAEGYSQTAIGRYNIEQGSYNSIVATDNAFIIGNGTSDSLRSNAFKVTFDGKTWTQDNFYVGASNYEVYHAGNLTPLKVTSVPASATATGTAGQFAYDTNYFYVCVATDTWCRYAKSSWE